MMVEPLPRWEYRRMERTPSVEELNELGAIGWELVAIDTIGSPVLRRPAQSFVERVTMEQRATYYASLGLDPEGNR